ncbi:MAG: glycosyltransferase family 39 protein [Chloroflexi bacterium]|nr:glycosyltransferase family 39 protein [Chloroflexota bacterium]
MLLIERRPLRRTEITLFIAVMLVAAFLRMGNPGITEFEGYEATLSQLARDVATGEDFTLVGTQSSDGFPNSPVSVYLLTLPYALDNNPVLAHLFVGLMNLLALALIWKFARRYYGRVAAFVAGLAFAVSPWAVIYSRTVGAQNLLVPFVVATVFTGTLGFLEPQPKRPAQWLHIPLLALTVQVHLSAISLIPLSLLIVWLGRENINRAFWIGLALMVLLALPFAIGFIDSETSLSDVFDMEGDSEFSFEAAEMAWHTVVGTNIHSLAGLDANSQYRDSLPPFTYEEFIIWMIFAAGLVGWWIWRNRRERPFLIMILIAWALLPVLTFTLEWTEPEPHYFIPMMPAVYILIAAGITQFYRRPLIFRDVWQQFASYVILIFLFVAGAQAWSVWALYQFLDDHYAPRGFGTPLHYLLDVRDELDRAERVVVYVDGTIPASVVEQAVWSFLLDDVQVTDVSEFEPPAEVGTYALVTPSVATPPPDADMVIDLRPGEGSYHIWSIADD